MVKQRLSHKIETILVIAPAWIGDMIMAQSLFKFLKFQNPSVAIDVLAPSWTIHLVEKMPEVRRGILFPFVHGKFKPFQRYIFAKKLRKYHYDQAIVLPSSFKSALTPLWAKIPLRTGWLGEWRLGLLNDLRFLNKKNLPLMIERFISLGLTPNQLLPTKLDDYFPSLRINREKRQELVKKWQLNIQKKILAICPGAEYGISKRWPFEYFAAVAKDMLSRGWQVWIFGSNKDAQLADSIMEATQGGCVNLAGKTTLLEAVELLSLAQGAICNDSGLMHISSALNIPLVVLYGSSTPHFTPPLTKNVAIIHLNLECSPCFKRSCPLEHFNCMKKITPQIVMSNLNDLIKYD